MSEYEYPRSNELLQISKNYELQVKNVSLFSSCHHVIDTSVVAIYYHPNSGIDTLTNRLHHNLSSTKIAYHLFLSSIHHSSSLLLLICRICSRALIEAEIHLGKDEAATKMINLISAKLLPLVTLVVGSLKYNLPGFCILLSYFLYPSK